MLHRLSTCAIHLLVVVLLACVNARSERLPLTTYTSLDGLAGDDISCVVEDRQGFLWIGTEKGLSRFDGHGFRNFGRAQGLLKSNVTDLALAPDGTIWIGVWGGVYRFEPTRGGTFTEFPLEGVRRPLGRTLVAVDATGGVWCGFDALYHLETTDKRPHLQRVERGHDLDLPFVSVLLPDNDGGIWFGYKHLYHLDREGLLTEAEINSREPVELVSITQDEKGLIWAGAVNSVWRVLKSPGGRFTLQRVPGLSLEKSIGVHVVSAEEGGTWAGSREGLYRISSNGEVVVRITRREGLITSDGRPLLRDHSGDLWLGSGESGLMRLTRNGFTSFGSADGLQAARISSIFRSPGNELIVVGEPHVLQLYRKDRFIAVRPQLATTSGWGWNQAEIQDRSLHWWIPTGIGLVRFGPSKSVTGLITARPLATYVTAGCFRGGEVFRIYEDRKSDLWISTIERDHEALYRRDSRTGEFSCFNPKPFPGAPVAATAFREDFSGTLWIGSYRGQVVRYRSGQFQCVLDCEGNQNGLINEIYLDRRGRLWISTARAGVIRIDNPSAEQPLVTKLTTNEGLSSNLVRTVVEDTFGRVYVGTELGVDILAENSGEIRHLGVEDGLPHHYVSVAWADPDGDIWFGTFNGLARYSPGPQDRKIAVPRVLLDGVRIAGRSLPLSISGQTDLAGVVMNPDQRDAEITFLGLPRSMSAGMRFQYRLSEHSEWSQPSTVRSVVLAGLNAGEYRLEIRALDAAGNPSSHVARFSFRVLAHFYERPWFLLLSSAALIGLLLGAYRLRLGRLLALQQLRTRIAMDLHDEMGSGLGSIGLLADLASSEHSSEPGRESLLGQIATTASDLGSSLTDIIWSLRTQDESIKALGHHLADRARRMFPGPAPVLITDFPEVWPDINLTLAVRRNVLLIGLEALHNAARHSEGKTVSVQLRPQTSLWCLSISDDGKGLKNDEPEERSIGFGFETMMKRSLEIGAKLEVESNADTGTRIVLLFNPSHRERRTIWFPLPGRRSYDHPKDKSSN